MKAWTLAACFVLGFVAVSEALVDVSGGDPEPGSEPGPGSVSVEYLYEGDRKALEGKNPYEDDLPIGRGRISWMPPFFKNEGVEYFTLSEGGRAGGKFKLTCNGAPGCKCTFFVAVYSCPPCSRHFNGGLPEMIDNEEYSFKARSCGPKFREHEEAEYDENPTVLLRKEVPAGSSVHTMEMTKPAPFVGVFASACGVPVEWCEKIEPPVLPLPPPACGMHCAAH